MDGDVTPHSSLLPLAAAVDGVASRGGIVSAGTNFFTGASAPTGVASLASNISFFGDSTFSGVSRVGFRAASMMMLLGNLNCAADDSLLTTPAFSCRQFASVTDARRISNARGMSPANEAKSAMRRSSPKGNERPLFIPEYSVQMFPDPFITFEVRRYGEVESEIHSRAPIGTFS